MRLVLVPLLLVLGSTPALAAPQTDSPAREIEAFNRAFDEATRRTDSAATLAQWEDDGVDLLPSVAPLRGKPAIARFLHEVLSQLAGAKMRHFEDHCFDIEVSGDWASEWCIEHQIVDLPGKPTFDGWGKMLLVLHRGPDHKWRIAREMWNQEQPPPRTRP